MKARTTLTTCLLILCLSLAARWIAPRAAAQNTSNNAVANVCGTVTEYIAATGTTPGALRIAGLRFNIAPGAVLSGVAPGQNLCFYFCMDNAGNITGQIGTSVAAAVTQVCGFVTNFTPSLGSSNGAVTIGGAQLSLAQGTYFPGQERVYAGANVCLYPQVFGNQVLPGSAFVSGAPAQVHVPTTVQGRTFSGQNDMFPLGQPFVLTLDPGLNFFAANPASFNIGTGPGYQLEGFALSAPNAVAQAIACTESLWDVVFDVASLGATNGDMITFKLLRADRTFAEQLAMFTLQNGGVALTQVHANVRAGYASGQLGTGAVVPFLVSAGAAGTRTGPITLVLSTTAPAFNACFQLAVEIKRASGVGTTSVVLEQLVVKRMEVPGDRDASLGVGQHSSSAGWFPTGRVCDVVCATCTPSTPTPTPSTPTPTPPSSLSGFVYCDDNGNGMRDAGEKAISCPTKITLTGTTAGGVAVNLETTSGDNGFYIFNNLVAGTYTLTETQPPASCVTGDGADKAGTLGGTVGNDVISAIVLPVGGNGADYNFGENCTPPVSTKCSTVCWRATGFFLSPFASFPGGTVLISGVNANNPVGIMQNTSAVRLALQGSGTSMKDFNRTFVTAQLSLSSAGGPGSAVVFDTFWSPLSCSGITFTSVTLSNNVTLTPASLLDTLFTQSVLAVKENRFDDMGKLASIWTLLNGRCFY